MVGYFASFVLTITGKLFDGNNCVEYCIYSQVPFLHLQFIFQLIDLLMRPIVLINFGIITE